MTTTESQTPSPWQQLTQLMAARDVAYAAGQDVSALERQIADLRWGPLDPGTNPLTEAQLAEEREQARAAKADNARARQAAGLPQLKTGRHKPSLSGVRAAIAQVRLRA